MNTIIKTTALSAIFLLTSASYATNITNEKTSYVIGTQIGNKITEDLNDVEKMGVTLDKKLVMKGVIDVLTNKVSLSDKEMKIVLDDFDRQMKGNKAEEVSKTDKNKAYLMQNELKDNVKTTSSGLQYEILKRGNNKRPYRGSSVTVHYKGTFIDGKEFDSSYRRNSPSTFRLNQVISGWTEGVQLMSEGARYKFTIPSNLAYGKRGNSTIPPDSTLVFEIELLKINQ